MIIVTLVDTNESKLVFFHFHLGAKNQRMINEPRITVVICICEACVEQEELVLLRKCKQPGLRLRLSSVASVVQVRVINLLNFIPLSISEVTNLCFHEVINHTPVGVGLHNELRKTCESRVKHCVFVHESMIGYRFGVLWVRGDSAPTVTPYLGPIPTW